MGAEHGVISSFFYENPTASSEIFKVFYILRVLLEFNHHHAFHQILSGDQITDCERDGAGGGVRIGLCGETRGKESPGSARRTQEGNGMVGIDWINLASDRDS